MNKSYIIFFIVMCTTILFSSCQNSKELTSSDDIGTYAFGILTQLNTCTEQEFLQNLYTYEEMNAYVKKHSYEFEKEFLDNYAVVTKTNFDSRLIKDYKKLKETGTSFLIDWTAIEPIEFKYWPRAKYGVKSMKGDLFFGYDKKAYKVTVTAFEAGDSYFVTKIENLQKASTDKKK